MKKIISILLTAIMVVSTVAVISIPTLAAVDGDWSVYTALSQTVEGDGYTGVVHHIAGYQYIEDLGLQTISPTEEEAANTTPYVTLQTTDKISLQDGVYMKVRVDEFTYSGDSLFAFSVWDQQGIEPGKQGDDYGLGAEMLIRPINEGDKDYPYNESNKNTHPGAVHDLQWYSDIEKGERYMHAYQTATEDMKMLENDKDGEMSFVYSPDFNKYYDEDGTPVFVLEIQWNDEQDMLEMYVNGAPAPVGFNQKMTDYFYSDAYMAHIGFTMYNSNVGGKAQCTILEWGTDAKNATPPIGDDEKEPEIITTNYADIAPAGNVPEGNPAIVLGGLSETSDSKGKPSAFNGNPITVTNEGYVNIKANTVGDATASFRVKDSVSYDVSDFPIAMIITRNFCTCQYKANEETNELEAICTCKETMKVFALAGHNMADNDKYSFKTMENVDEDILAEIPGETYVENFKDKQDNSYLYFMVDFTSTINYAESLKEEPVEMTDPLTGRIHGLRIDVEGLNFSSDQSYRNNFDICQIAFFRDVEEAQNYARAYIMALGDVEVNTQEPETTPEETTPSDNTNNETTTGKQTEAVTEEKTEKQTEAKKTEETEGEEKSGGCGSTVGFGTAAVIALVGTALIGFRKKKED